MAFHGGPTLETVRSWAILILSGKKRELARPATLLGDAIRCKMTGLVGGFLDYASRESNADRGRSDSGKIKRLMCRKSSRNYRRAGNGIGEN